MSRVTGQALDRTIARAQPRGRVLLVGAGPGDPELLTMRAHRILTNATIVAYDELVSPEILALIRPDAERIAVGRRRGTHPNAPSIHPIVLERALAGLDVVRLKGGDPMIFGRGGEEAAELDALRIPFEIVPGVSAALGAAASTGIPLTHRDAASSVTFATAHLREAVAAQHAPANSNSNKNGTDAVVGELASRVPREGTVVLYMGVSTIGATARHLMDAGGRAASTPVAVVSRATLPDERVVIADLGTIAAVVERESLETPALVIIGDVVSRRVVPSSRRLAAHVEAAASAVPLAKTAAK